MIPQTMKMLKLLKKLNNSKSFDKNLNLENKIEMLLNKKDFEFCNNIKENQNERINPMSTEEKIDLIFNKIIIKNEESNNKLPAQLEKRYEELNDNCRKFYLDFKKISVNNHTCVKKENKNEIKISVNNHTSEIKKNEKKKKSVGNPTNEIKKQFKEMKNKKKKMKEELKKIREEESKKSGLLTSYSKDMKNILKFSSEHQDKNQTYLKILNKVMHPHNIYWEDFKTSEEIKNKLVEKAGLKIEEINNDKIFCTALRFFEDMINDTYKKREKAKFDAKWEEELDECKYKFEVDCSCDWLEYMKLKGVVDSSSLAKIFKEDYEKGENDRGNFYYEKYQALIKNIKQDISQGKL